MLLRSFICLNSAGIPAWDRVAAVLNPLKATTLDMVDFLRHNNWANKFQASLYYTCISYKLQRTKFNTLVRHLFIMSAPQRSIQNSEPSVPCAATRRYAFEHPQVTDLRALPWISHFAAYFIETRSKTSTAEDDIHRVMNSCEFETCSILMLPSQLFIRISQYAQQIYSIQRIVLRNI